MRVTSAIFMLEFPGNGVQGMETPSVQERLQAADQDESKTFVSLYSGKAGMGQLGKTANGKPRAATRSEAGFAFSFEMRIECAKNGYPDSDSSN